MEEKNLELILNPRKNQLQMVVIGLKLKLGLSQIQKDVAVCMGKLILNGR